MPTPNDSGNNAVGCMSVEKFWGLQFECFPVAVCLQLVAVWMMIYLYRKQEKMSAPSADMICSRPSSCRASTVTAAPSVERDCTFALDFAPLSFQPKIGSPITRALRNIYTSFDFSTFYRAMHYVYSVVLLS